jgi:putative nucleotidyltransferase with HDIG domain
MSPVRAAVKSGRVSAEFERFVVFVIAAVAVFHLFTSLTGAESPLPPGATLGVTLGLVLYLWLARSRAMGDLLEMHRRMEQSQVSMIGTLVETIEARDPYTAGHSARVRRVATELARELGLPDETVDLIGRSAILHDIGKLGIRDSLLHKKEKLNDEDWKALREHPQKSFQILSGLEFLDEEMRIALLHHERYDGKGYVTGLKGDQIPVEASVISVADAFDAMNSERPYRGPMPKDAILAELEKGKDKQHAARVVEAFLGLLAKKPELWIRA